MNVSEDAQVQDQYNRFCTVMQLSLREEKKNSQNVGE